MWLVEAAGLRLLCDPLLGPVHHGGVFETVPRRVIDAPALRPDFVLVSHRHPDHFDVASLHRLARLDPDSVVVTPDALVVWAAKTLGFRTVHQLPPAQHVQLDGLRLVTTPSIAPDEWGVMIAADGAVGWNQVDTVLRDAAHVQQVRQTALDGLGLTQAQVDLAVVRWQPMLEIAAVLGRRTAFPYTGYGDLLAQVAAVEATAVVPGANGAAHVDEFRWLDRFVFPVPESRFLRDIQRVQPGVRAFPLQVGSRFEVEPGAVHVDAQGASALVHAEAGGDPRRYHPLSIPALEDPNPGGHELQVIRPKVHAWIRGALADGLAQAWPDFDCAHPLACALEVVFPDARDVFTLHVGPDGVRVVPTLDEDWDLLNGVSGSLLYEVIEGRRHWGDVLLAGGLRASTRAYTVDAQGLRRASIAETFVYYGVSYDDSVERAVRWEVRRCIETSA